MRNEAIRRRGLTQYLCILVMGAEIQSKRICCFGKQGYASYLFYCLIISCWINVCNRIFGLPNQTYVQRTWWFYFFDFKFIFLSMRAILTDRYSLSKFQMANTQIQTFMKPWRWTVRTLVTLTGENALKAVCSWSLMISVDGLFISDLFTPPKCMVVNAVTPLR